MLEGTISISPPKFGCDCVYGMRDGKPCECCGGGYWHEGGPCPRREKMASQPERLKAFWRDLVEHFVFGGPMEMDGATFEELASKHGLIRWEIFDPANFSDEEREYFEAEKGDWIWRNDVT